MRNESRTIISRHSSKGNVARIFDVTNGDNSTYAELSKTNQVFREQLSIFNFKGHFDETLGADFFLFSETAFFEIHTSKISAENIE